MEGIENVLARFTVPPKMKPGDYVGEDGCVYCGVCREPRQIIQPAGNVFPEDVKINVMCRCDMEERDRRLAEEAQRQLEEQIARYRKAAFPPGSSYSNVRFANADNTPLIQAAQKYVELFEDFKHSGTGIHFYGETGTGKTFAAACIVNALIDKGYRCIMTNPARIANKLQSSFEGRNEYYDELNRVPLLVLDDLRAERHTEFMNEVVFNVIDGRCNAHLPLIVTSNLTAQELSAKGDNIDLFTKRINSRMNEICHPILCKGKDRREDSLREKYQQTKALLGM